MNQPSLAGVLATVGGNLYLVLGTAVCALAALALVWVPRVGQRLFFAIARLWSRGLLLASGVRVAVSGDRLDGSRRYVFMANHQSLYDIPVLLATLPLPARFLAKRSLFRIPLFGWAIKAGGFVTIDRQDRSRMREAFAEALSRLASGTSVLVFPEGTRALDGRLHAFQRGGFLLAMRGGFDIVPVGVRGTDRVQLKGSRRIRPGRVEVRFGRPIATAGVGVGGKAELMAEVRREIAGLAGLEPA